MAMETWTSQSNNPSQKPPGEGWAIAGYRQYRPSSGGGKMGTPNMMQIPIYMRQAPQAAPAPTPPPPPPPAPTAAQPSYGKQYTYTDPGDKGFFGMKDYEELASQGASRADMIRYAFSAPSGVGPSVASMLGIRAFNAPTPSSLSYTDPGDKGFFGMKDFEELASQGATLQQIKDYAGKAQYGVGGEAASILGMKPATEANMVLSQADQKVKDFEDAQKRAEEANKLQQEMMIRSQATMSANLARSGRTPNLQIAPSGQTPGTAGTQSFKRRRGQMTTVGSAMSALPGTTAQSSILNV
jgi:hypothetical protein